MPHTLARLSPATSRRPLTEPVRVELVSVPLVVEAGLHSLLDPHRDRVRIAPRSVPGRPHVVLFDPWLASGDELARLPHGCVRVAVTRCDDTPSTRRATSMGARGMLDLSAGTDDLVRSIEAAARGQVDSRTIAAPAPGTAHLTARESDILQRVCRGMSNQEIADELYLSINSVKTYIRTLYRKIGATRRSQAVLWGVENGF